MTKTNDQPTETTILTPVVGPWKQTTVSKFQVQAMEITFTKDVECTHVPPVVECGEHDQKESGQGQVYEVLQAGLAMVMQKLEEIRAAQSGE